LAMLSVVRNAIPPGWGLALALLVAVAPACRAVPLVPGSDAAGTRGSGLEVNLADFVHSRPSQSPWGGAAPQGPGSGRGLLTGGMDHPGGGAPWAEGRAGGRPGPMAGSLGSLPGDLFFTTPVIHQHKHHRHH